MGNCKDCDSWNSGICNNINVAYTNFPKKFSINSHDFAILYSCLDDSDLDIYLRTGSDFGCVQFKLRSRR